MLEQYVRRPWQSRPSLSSLCRPANGVEVACPPSSGSAWFLRVGFGRETKLWQRLGCIRGYQSVPLVLRHEAIGAKSV
jgi:hypothetical protein